MQSNTNLAPKYQYPPIMEAVIELRVNGVLTLKEREKIAKKLKKDYPNSQEINEVGINIGPNGAESAVTVNEPAKIFRLASDSQSEIIIISPQSLAVACLAPYPGWDDYLTKVVAAWKIWKSIAGTRVISRVGVRFINRIDIPVNGVEKIELEDYLSFFPKVPSFSDSPMENYFIQITKRTSNQLWSTNITSTIQPPPMIGYMSLLLDIDVYRTEEIPLNDEDLWGTISEARELKNGIFCRLITQRTAELFV
jgi:uncharacterized protein (TIGR04255 family)